MNKLPKSTEAWLAIWVVPVTGVIMAIKDTFFPDLSVSENQIAMGVSFALTWIFARVTKKWVAKKNGG